MGQFLSSMDLWSTSLMWSPCHGLSRKRRFASWPVRVSAYQSPLIAPEEGWWWFKANPHMLIQFLVMLRPETMQQARGFCFVTSMRMQHIVMMFLARFTAGAKYVSKYESFLLTLTWTVLGHVPVPSLTALKSSFRNDSCVYHNISLCKRERMGPVSSP